ncbi:hypothetical protein D0Z06_24795 [Geodermatophilus marinus]|nr:hypothetical protein D0Z06_24795 [Geodermatophilus sp. LHW52908]
MRHWCVTADRKPSLTRSAVKIKSPGVACDGFRVILLLGHALSAGTITSSVAESVLCLAMSWMRQRARTLRSR